jgi:hypothetical protein
VYGTLIAIFDTLDIAVLRWSSLFDKKLEERVRKTNSPPSFVLTHALMQPVESDQWDDAEIMRRFDDAEGVSPNVPHVRKIGDDPLVKASCNLGAPHLEASSFEFVRMRTTIPIPRVWRMMKDEDGDTLIVMDYIPGERLDHVWPSLSLWSKLCVAFTLR